MSFGADDFGDKELNNSICPSDQSALGIFRAH